MNRTLPRAINRELDELSQDERAVVTGGMIDTGGRPVRERTPGRLTPDDDEDGTIAGAAMGW